MDVHNNASLTPRGREGMAVIALARDRPAGRGENDDSLCRASMCSGNSVRAWNLSVWGVRNCSSHGIA